MEEEEVVVVVVVVVVVGVVSGTRIVAAAAVIKPVIPEPVILSLCPSISFYIGLDANTFSSAFAHRSQFPLAP